MYQSYPDQPGSSRTVCPRRPCVRVSRVPKLPRPSRIFPDGLSTSSPASKYPWYQTIQDGLSMHIARVSRVPKLPRPSGIFPDGLSTSTLRPSIPCTKVTQTIQDLPGGLSTSSPASKYPWYHPGCSRMVCPCT